MTWSEPASATTPTWVETGAAAKTWVTPSGASAFGNLSRMIDADALQDAQGGVDFNNTFSSENPFAFTVQGPIALVGTNRNDPT